ncbi:MAG: OFA family MFS transporter [Bacteroidales bacterium]|nr:OFA family MFS transporter [Bacteroidales bacterium]
MTSTKKSTGWFIAMAALCINLILGILYSWSVIKKELVSEWSWSNTEASIPYIVSVASFAITMIFAGRAQDKYGPRPVAIFGGILLGGGLIASSLAHSLPLMILTFGIIGGMGIGFAYSAVTPCAIKWFDGKRKGLISGIVVSGVGLSPVYMAPITNMLLKSHTIEETFLYLGIFSLIGIVILAMFMKNPPAGYVPESVSKKPATKANDFSWQEMVKTRPFWLLWIAFLMGGTAGLMLIGHITSIAKVQANWEGGYLLVVILALFNALGRVSGGILSDKIGRTTSMLIFFLVQAVNMFLFSYYQSVPMLIAGTVVAGWAYGALFALFPAATGDFFGMKNFGVNYGLIFCGWGVGGVVGPLLGGSVADATGTYSISYIVSAIMLLMGAAIVKFTKAPVKA